MESGALVSSRRLTSEDDQALALVTLRVYTSLHREKRRIQSLPGFYKRILMPDSGALSRASWVLQDAITGALRSLYSVARELAPRYTYSLFLFARASPLHSLHAIAYPPDSVWMLGTDPRVWAGKLAGLQEPEKGVRVSVGGDAVVLARATRRVVGSLLSRGRRLPRALGQALGASGGDVGRALYMVYWASLILALNDAVMEGVVGPGTAETLASKAPRPVWGAPRRLPPRGALRQAQARLGPHQAGQDQEGPTPTGDSVGAPPGQLPHEPVVF